MDSIIPRKVQLALRAALQREEPDPTPVEIPPEYQRPESLEDRLRSFVRGELSRAALASGYGTAEEEDDFELPEGEEDLLSPWQVRLMEEDFPPAEPSAEESDSESGADSAPEGGPKASGSDSPGGDRSEAPPASNPPPG